MMSLHPLTAWVMSQLIYFCCYWPYLG